VTGAGRGVGEAIARELHNGGARVAVSDIDAAAARAVAKSLDDSGATAIAFALDVTVQQAFADSLAAIVQAWGKVDIVINNAGLGKRTPTAEIDADEFDAVVAINMRSVFFSCQLFGEHMRANGYGRIVNITSLAGQNGGTVASPHYAASKAGAIMLSKYFARELAASGVTVNAIAPGPIATSTGRLSPDQIDMMKRVIPIGRMSEASEIAAAVALLASDRGGFFVGATLDMNGGLYMR
jgi:3-oxoacyl-[acyl-carrier protein] reductase